MTNKEAQANKRANQLLAPVGRTIATMTAEDYEYVKAQLMREGLWHGGKG